MFHWDTTAHYFTATIFSHFPVNVFFGDRNLTEDNAASIIHLTQVHGDTIVYIPSPEKNLKADGLITKTRLLTLSVKTADCVPIIFYDPNTNTSAISHQGWRGLFKELPKKMIQRLIKYRSHPENIIAAIGPSINDCCYQVDRKLFSAFSESLPEYKEAYIKRESRYYLNLQKLAYDQLLSAGMKSTNIDHFPFCTKCDARFYSYRRNGTSERMISSVTML